jgi:hypothetical protein
VLPYSILLASPESRSPAPPMSQAAKPLPTSLRVPIGKLPFVGLKRDGALGFWVIPADADNQEVRLVGRTYAAWFMLYAEGNGPLAASDLLDQIEREMPSRLPALDRVFLAEITRPVTVRAQAKRA